MSTNEQYPSAQSGPSTNEQIPHSGVHGYEAPVDTSHDTSLQDAHDQGLLTVPENPAVLTVEKKKGSLKNKIVVALAGLGLVGGGIAGYSAMKGGEAPERTDTTSAGATKTPGTKIEKATPEQAPAAGFGIPAEKYKANPELLGQEYYRQLNEFRIAGATEEAASSDRAYEITKEEFVAEFSTPINSEFIEDMFIPDWETNPELADYVHAELAIATRTRELRILSYGGGTDAIEPYVRETVPESIQGTVDPLRTSTRWVGRDNGPNTSVADNMDGQDVNTMAGGETLTWVNVGGQLKIADVTHFNG